MFDSCSEHLLRIYPTKVKVVLVKQITYRSSGQRISALRLPNSTPLRNLTAFVWDWCRPTWKTHTHRSHGGESGHVNLEDRPTISSGRLTSKGRNTRVKERWDHVKIDRLAFSRPATATNLKHYLSMKAKTKKPKKDYALFKNLMARARRVKKFPWMGQLNLSGLHGCTVYKGRGTALATLKAALYANSHYVPDGVSGGQERLCGLVSSNQSLFGWNAGSLQGLGYRNLSGLHKLLPCSNSKANQTRRKGGTDIKTFKYSYSKRKGPIGMQFMDSGAGALKRVSIRQISVNLGLQLKKSITQIAVKKSIRWASRRNSLKSATSKEWDSLEVRALLLPNSMEAKQHRRETGPELYPKKSRRGSSTGWVRPVKRNKTRVALPDFEKKTPKNFTIGGSAVSKHKKLANLRRWNGSRQSMKLKSNRPKLTLTDRYLKLAASIPRVHPKEKPYLRLPKSKYSNSLPKRVVEGIKLSLAKKAARRLKASKKKKVRIPSQRTKRKSRQVINRIFWTYFKQQVLEARGAGLWYKLKYTPLKHQNRPKYLGRYAFVDKGGLSAGIRLATNTPKIAARVGTRGSQDLVSAASLDTCTGTYYAKRRVTLNVGLPLVKTKLLISKGRRQKRSTRWFVLSGCRGRSRKKYNHVRTRVSTSVPLTSFKVAKVTNPRTAAKVMSAHFKVANLNASGFRGVSFKERAFLRKQILLFRGALSGPKGAGNQFTPVQINLIQQKLLYGRKRKNTNKVRRLVGLPRIQISKERTLMKRWLRRMLGGRKRLVRPSSSIYWKKLSRYCPSITWPPKKKMRRGKGLKVRKGALILKKKTKIKGAARLTKKKKSTKKVESTKKKGPNRGGKLPKKGKLPKGKKGRRYPYRGKLRGKVRFRKLILAHARHFTACGYRFGKRRRVLARLKRSSTERARARATRKRKLAWAKLTAAARAELAAVKGPITRRRKPVRAKAADERDRKPHFRIEIMGKRLQRSLHFKRKRWDKKLKIPFRKIVAVNGIRGMIRGASRRLLRRKRRRRKMRRRYPRKSRPNFRRRRHARRPSKNPKRGTSWWGLGEQLGGFTPGGKAKRQPKLTRKHRVARKILRNIYSNLLSSRANFGRSAVSLARDQHVAGEVRLLKGLNRFKKRRRARSRVNRRIDTKRGDELQRRKRSRKPRRRKHFYKNLAYVWSTKSQKKLFTLHKKWTLRQLRLRDGSRIAESVRLSKKYRKSSNVECRLLLTMLDVLNRENPISVKRSGQGYGRPTLNPMSRSVYSHIAQVKSSIVVRVLNISTHLGGSKILYSDLVPTYKKLGKRGLFLVKKNEFLLSLITMFLLKETEVWGRFLAKTIKSLGFKQQRRFTRALFLFFRSWNANTWLYGSIMGFYFKLQGIICVRGGFRKRNYIFSYGLVPSNNYKYSYYMHNRLLWNRAGAVGLKTMLISKK